MGEFEIEESESSVLKKIKQEYGDVETFIKHGKEWLDKLPAECVEANDELRVVKEKNVDWSDPTVIAIVERKMTSLEHADWLSSVLDRIDHIIQEVRSTDVEDMGERASGVPKDLGDSLDDFIEKQLQKQKQSAIDFLIDVRTYAREKFTITPKQLERLNDIYKRYKKI